MATQARKYLITQNNPTDYGYNSTEEFLNIANELSGLMYGCVSEEIGNKTKTTHYHCGLTYKNPKNWQTIKNLYPNADIESARGTCQQIRDYVFKEGKWKGTDKEDTRIDGTQVEIGEMPPERESYDPKSALLLKLIQDGSSDYEILTGYPEYMFDLSTIQRVRLTLLQAEYEDKWRDVYAFYIHGAPGLGKTRLIMDGFGYKNVFRVTDTLHPWDTYQCEDVVVFEEFASSFKIQDMNNYLDSYPLKLPARYSDKTACYTKVFVISNLPLKKQYPNIQAEEDRTSKDTYRAFLRRFKGVIEFLDEFNLEYYVMDENQHPIYKGTFTHKDFWEKLNSLLANGTSIEPTLLSKEEIEELLKSPIDPNKPIPMPAP